MKNLLMKYVVIVKENVTNGIVVSEYKDITVVKCVDYISDDNVEGYTKPLERTAKQLGSLMGFTQIY